MAEPQIGIPAKRHRTQLAFAASVLCAAALYCVGASNAATPDDNAGPSRGLAYAQVNCANCHAIAAGQRSPSPRARTFEAIANTPGMTRTALSAWLHTSHPSMPNLIISPNEIDDLSDYIATLKKPAATP